MRESFIPEVDWLRRAEEQAVTAANNYRQVMADTDWQKGWE